MGEIIRNSIKGYSYQQSIFILFLAIMDIERNISKITVEALNTKIGYGCIENLVKKM